MVEPLSADFSPVSPTEIRRGPVIDVKAVELKPVDPPAKAAPPKKGFGAWVKSWFVSEAAAAPAPATANGAGGQPPVPPKGTGAIQLPPADAPKGLPAPKGTELAIRPAGPVGPVIPPAATAAQAEGLLSKVGGWLKAVAANPIVNKVIAPVGAAISGLNALGETLNSKNGLAQRVVSGLETLGYGASVALATTAVVAAPFTGGASLALLPVAATVAGGTLLASEAIRTGAHLLGAGDPTGEKGIKPGLAVGVAQGVSNLISGPAVPDAKAAPGQVVAPGDGRPVAPGQVVAPGDGRQPVPAQAPAAKPYSSIAAIAAIKDGQTFARHQTAALNGVRGVGTQEQRVNYQREAVTALGGEEAAKKVMEKLYNGDAAKVKIAMDRLYDGKSHGPETRAIAAELKGEAAKVAAAAGDKTPGIIGPKTIAEAKKKAPAAAAPA